MSLLAGSVIDWGALWQVIWISALAGVGIALVLGLGIVASLRAGDGDGNVIALRGVTVVSVLVVAAAIAAGLLTIINK